MTRIRLERWSVRDNPYAAPEVRSLHLEGYVYGDTRCADGSRRYTTRVVAVDGRYATTANGSVYWLGEPDPDFVAYLQREGIPFDPENPICVRRKGI